jgi:cystathionine beta-synthase
LVKEEGIFCGGSSGTAVAAAIRYGRGLSSDRLVVVILPDSGSRYLSKVFDDKWMRENGFLEFSWAEVTLGELIDSKPSPLLISAPSEARMSDVIAQMKEYDISQVPAVNADGTLAGLVTEVDLLKHMLEADHEHSPDESIAGILQPAEAVYPSHSSLEEVLPQIVDGYVVLVTEAERPVGILTKIDVLDYIARSG